MAVVEAVAHTVAGATVVAVIANFNLWLTKARSKKRAFFCSPFL